MTEALDVAALAERIRSVQTRIVQAATRVRRTPGSVRLIAVSKRHPASLIRAAYACGLRDFGENYVQELMGKAEALSDLTEIRWHLIGHLQRNKARHVAKVAHVVHTVDNADLVDELSRRLVNEQREVAVCIEVNVAQEPQKNGCAPADVPELVQHIRKAPNLVYLGLMTVGPRVDTAEQARGTFVALRELRDVVTPNAALSMGMSGDFEVAIEEGASDVRVGTAIFGARR